MGLWSGLWAIGRKDWFNFSTSGSKSVSSVWLEKFNGPKSERSWDVSPFFGVSRKSSKPLNCDRFFRFEIWPTYGDFSMATVGWRRSTSGLSRTGEREISDWAIEFVRDRTFPLVTFRRGVRIKSYSKKWLFARKYRKNLPFQPNHGSILFSAYPHVFQSSASILL